MAGKTHCEPGGNQRLSDCSSRKPGAEKERCLQVRGNRERQDHDPSPFLQPKEAERGRGTAGKFRAAGIEVTSRGLC